MQQVSNRNHMPRHRRLKALAAIAALSLGSLALAGCGNDDELSPMEPDDPPMEQPTQEAPMGDEPSMDQDPAMSEEPMDPMENQEPMMDDEEAGNY
ncbi:hypothetical protein ACM26W_05205 [Halomonas sp. HK25]|uniref:hypothetical protein n=1 Tax=Halomonas sp. HK25 TaxID=3394321 RepID=UPI0039FD1FFA